MELGQVNLPPKLAQRLDVLDFATPVQSIVTQAQVSAAARAWRSTSRVRWIASAYQSGNQYVVEIAAKKKDAKAVDGKLAKGQEPDYSGNRVTFNFQDIPTRSVLQLIADVSDLNIVASDTVGGNVTLRLVNVPWDQALDVVLHAKSLDKRRNGNVIWIAPQEEMAKYEQSHCRRPPEGGRQCRAGYRLYPDQLWQGQGHRQAPDHRQYAVSRRRR